MGSSKNKLRKKKMREAVQEGLHHDPVDKPVTTSSAKLCESDYSDNDSDSDSDEFELDGNGYRWWEWDQLQTLISSACVCKKCGSSVTMVEDVCKRKGWCSVIRLECTSCATVEYLSTSPARICSSSSSSIFFKLWCHVHIYIYKTV